MMRLAIIMAVFAVPAMAQTPISDRPGRWVSAAPRVPPSALPDTPAENALPEVETATVEPVLPVAIEPTPLEFAPEIRPQPRPASITALSPLEVVEAPDIALNVSGDVTGVLIVPDHPAEVLEASDISPEIAVDVSAAVADSPSDALAADVSPAPEILPEPQDIASVPDVRPAPRPGQVEIAASAEALAAEIAAAAMEIVTRPSEFAPEITVEDAAERLEPLQAEPSASVPLSEPQAPRVFAAVPSAATDAPGAPDVSRPLAVAAVLLPEVSDMSPPLMIPASVAVPPHDPAPVESRPRPSAPAAMDAMRPLNPPQSARFAALLLPSQMIAGPSSGQLSRVAAPALDPFPYSALPPSALPTGPAALERAVQPPAPLSETMSAVLIAPPEGAPIPLLPLGRPSAPARGMAPNMTERPAQLPPPDPIALARLVEETLICWRMASLGSEARWAELSVAVALDETNRAAASSIQLTAFGRVMSAPRKRRGTPPARP